MKKDLEQARYPKKVRDLAKLEAKAVEIGTYGNHNLAGLLQTEEYSRALIQTWRPAYSQDEVERMVAARMARRSIFERSPAPTLTFVQEEVTLSRPIGGRMVLRRQLERLLEVGQLRNVEVQVMPTDCDDHAGMGGRIQVLKFGDGSAVGHDEGQVTSRPISDPKRSGSLSCAMASSGPRLSPHGSPWPSSRNCWERHELQPLGREFFRAGVVQEQL